MVGTPQEVPVPKKVSFIGISMMGEDFGYSMTGEDFGYSVTGEDFGYSTTV
jgi:hypothetical protein